MAGLMANRYLISELTTQARDNVPQANASSLLSPMSGPRAVAFCTCKYPLLLYKMSLPFYALFRTGFHPCTLYLLQFQIVRILT
jgi:hypothetical protein